MFCTSCGATVEEDWAFCPECARPVRRPAAASEEDEAAVGDESPGSDGAHVVEQPVGRPLMAIGLLISAGGLTMASMFPAYFLHGTALIHNSQSWSFAVVAVAGWFVAGFLLLRARTAVLGAALAVGLTLAWIPVFLTAIGAVVNHIAAAGTGYWLGLGGVVLALASAYGCAIYLRDAGVLAVRRDRVGYRLALVGLVVGGGYLATTFANWTVSTTRLTLNGAKISKHSACCSLAHAHGWSLASQLLVVAAAVLIPAAAGLVASRATSAGLLIGAALGVGANAIAVLARISQAVDPHALGISSAAITQYDVHVSQRGLPALYIALALVALLLVIAAGHLRATRRKLPMPSSEPVAAMPESISTTA
jgi:hypothetical protein